MSLTGVVNSYGFTLDKNIRLKPGETVTVRVLKRLTPDKWAIGIAGKVFSAHSLLELHPEQILRARVTLNNGQIFLQLLNSSIDENLDNDAIKLLHELGLRGNSLSVEIVKQLLGNNMPISESIITSITRVLKKISSRLELDKAKLIKILILLIDKGIDIEKSDILGLLEILFFRNSSEDKERERRKREHRGKETNNTNASNENEQLIGYLKKSIKAKTEDQLYPLQLFNHLKGKHSNWMLFPFNFIWKDAPLNGILKVKYTYTNKFEDSVLQINCEKGLINFLFHRDKNNKYVIHIFSDVNLKPALVKNLAELKSILRNLSVKIDDNIYDEKNFDGFAPEMETIDYSHINTTG